MSEATLERKRIIVRGRVQAVGFWLFTHGAAIALGVTGTVRNRPDDTVEAVAQAEPETMERFLWALRQGPPASQVTALDIEPLDVSDDIQGFHITR